MKKLRRLGNKKILIAVGTFLTVFGAFILMRALTLDATLEINTTFSLPEFNNAGELSTLSGYNYAVAVDGEIVSSNKMEEVRPTASTAKMILSLAVMKEKPFELGEKGEEIRINNEMLGKYLHYIAKGGSNTKVILGERISEYDALASVLLASSNNMADSLAIWAFGSLDNYREYASRMLEEYGISSTTIGPDASGFSPETTSTTEDLAKIGQLVLKNPVLKEIVALEKHEVPIAGELINSNKLLGKDRIAGIKTGWIGDISGYCLVTGYFEGEHIVTTALLGAPTREASFNESLSIVQKTQGVIPETKVISENEVIGSYHSWWTGTVPIKALSDLDVVGWTEANRSVDLEMNGESGILKVYLGNYEYQVEVLSAPYNKEPSFGERLAHVFGWQNNQEPEVTELEPVEEIITPTEEEAKVENEEKIVEEKKPNQNSSTAVTNVPSENCTIKFGYLMLINPNFTVTTDFIDARRSELVSISKLYGIVEGNQYNGDNLLDSEAAKHLNEMVNAYKETYPGHTFETRSCYRARGTTCGRLCAATGTSDHHTGLTCDLLDPVYGTSLDTDTYDQHPDWQWLRANSYKYGFIDRFPAAWAGGPMSEPINVDENGSTGLFETWHYRYVGVGPATDIATGKYNNGQYDSLEHYLKATGKVSDLKNGKCS